MRTSENDYYRERHEKAPTGLRRISWGSVLAGVVIALSIHFALSLLGLGIGAGVIDPYSPTPAQGLGIGSAIWFGLSLLIALFVGGWVAARLAGVPRTTDSILHGILTWSMFTLISFYLLTTAVGRIIGGVTGVIGQTLSIAGQGVQAIAPEIQQQLQQELRENNITLESIKEEAKAWLRATGKDELQPENLKKQIRESGQGVSAGASEAAKNPQQADQTVENVIDRLFSEGKDVVNEVDRQAAVNALMNKKGMSRAEAERTVDNWIQTYNQARQQFAATKEKVEEKTRKTADDVSSAISKAAIYSFFGIVLGVVAAAVGGNLGRPKEVVVTTD